MSGESTSISTILVLPGKEAMGAGHRELHDERNYISI